MQAGRVPKLSRTRHVSGHRTTHGLACSILSWLQEHAPVLVSPSSRHDSPRQALRDVEWKEEAEASTVTSDRIQLYRAALANGVPTNDPRLRWARRRLHPMRRRCDDESVTWRAELAGRRGARLGFLHARILGEPDRLSASLGRKSEELACTPRITSTLYSPAPRL